ncbi:hypothetical protein ALP14_101864 [Pseudomonas amygdali pv. myricae]|nr:hypothetical protein ALP14_101864 [Pseudomonas amygdali pv. myricae]
MGMQFVTLCVTRRFCYVSDVRVWLRSPFRPSASHFDEAKVTKTFRSCFRPDFVGFLRPDTDPGVAATGHPWPGAACSASCLAPPGSAPGLSRHLRRTLCRQCHRDHKALFSMCSDYEHRSRMCGAV